VKRLSGAEPDDADYDFTMSLTDFRQRFPDMVPEQVGRSTGSRRLDPDPVAVLLAALGALGSFASLAAYVEYKRDRQRERRRAKRTVLRAITAAREALDDIDGALLKLEKLMERSGEAGDVATLDAPVEFGAVNAFFDFFEFSAYQTLAQRVTRAFDTTIRETYEIMDAIEDGAIEAPRDLFAELRELQARLEKLRRARRSFSETIAATRHVTQRMAQIAEDLERHIALDRTG
jgi:methyl-accepting chemotaxis protein